MLIKSKSRSLERLIVKRSNIRRQVEQLLQKAGPTVSDVHINTPLTNISVAYSQRQEAYNATTIFPIVPVSKKSDLFYRYDKGDFLRDEARVRAPATESAGGDYKMTTDSYNANVYAFHKDIDDQTRANADSMLTLDRSATEFVTNKLLIKLERDFISNYFGAGIWGTDITGVAGTPSAGQVKQWNDAASTPAADVEAGKLAILAVTGRMPNVLAMTVDVFSALRYNANIKDQFKYTSADSIDKNMMANYFGVEKLVILSAIYTAGNEGAASPVTGFMKTKAAWLGYVAPTPTLLEPSAGYTFVWTGYLGGGAGGMQMSKYRMPLKKADRIEGETAYAMKVIASECGYMFNSIIA